MSTHVERPINPEEFTLVLKTRLRQGRISYDESDVRLKGWTACEKMEGNLLREWQSTNIAELLVFRENKTGKERTLVIKDFETRMKSLGESIGAGVSGLANAGAQAIAAGANVVGTSVEGLANIGANVVGTGLSAIGSMLSSSDSPLEAGTNSSPGDYDLNLVPD